MSLFYQISKNQNFLINEIELLIPIFNNIYDEELKHTKIKQYSNHNIICEYALINSTTMNINKDIKSAAGFGICFPTNDKSEKRIMLFEDLFKPKFLDICVAHEYAHLIGGNEKDAFYLELNVAKLIGLKKEWLNYNKIEYPNRLKIIKEYSIH